jgi:hypothetical protein
LVTTPDQPESPPPDQQASPPPPESPPEEDSALIPAILTAYAIYLAWRAAHNREPKGWRQVASAINLQGLIGDQLGMVATRAFRWQQQQAGRAGDDLWPFADEAVRAGIQAGVQTIAEGLLWTDTHSTGVPATQDAGASGEATAPTASNPPTLLAQMTAQAVVNSTIFAAVSAAGWTKKTWHSQEDARVRPTHQALNGTVAAMDAAFTSPSGAKLRFPGDPRAPISEVAHCRCFLQMGRR